MGEVTIDFVVRDQPHGGWTLVLVEQGPWPEDDVTEQLRRLQDRLYACLDAVFEGQIAEKFPDSRGLPLMIQIDAYDIESGELPAFFDRFTTGIWTLPDHRKFLAAQRDYPGIQFKLHLASTEPSDPSMEPLRKH